MPRLKPLFVAGLLAGILAPASASADFVTIGSDLTAPATIMDANPNDWSAWNTALPGGRATTSPVQGELNSVRIKGYVLQEYMHTEFVSVNVQVLRPQPDGQVKAMVTSERLRMPTTRDPNQITTFGLEQLNLPTSRMCVLPGDFISFFINGGFEVAPTGLQAMVFGRVPEATSQIFKSESAETVPGQHSPFPGTPMQGREVLLQATIATGPDARYFCRTDAEKAQGFPNPGEAPSPNTPTPATVPIDIPVPAHDPHVSSKGTVPIRVYCRALEGCRGTLTLLRGTAVVATTTLDVPARTTGRPRLKLSKAARRKLRKRGARLRVTAVATHGDYKVTQRLRLVRKGA